MLTRPIELGAQIVMHSATKYLNGHSDVIAGALASARDDELWQRIRYVRGGRRRRARAHSKRGSCCAACARCICASPPHPRARSRSRNTWPAHPKLGHVLYPGLADAPRTRHCREADAGRIRRDDVAAASRAAKARRSRSRRSSGVEASDVAGSVESLAEHRASVEGPGTLCPPDLVRLSIGVEHVDD
jgi:cystathionine gamma-synthase